MKRTVLAGTICCCLMAAVMMMPAHAADQPLSERLAGLILLQVEQAGEAWYLEPVTETRLYLGRPADAFQVMRQLGLGIRHQELSGYLTDGFPARLSGRIMLDVEMNGEAYYVYPNSLVGHYLGRPADAFQVMRQLGLGISNHNLSLIAVAADSAVPPASAATVTSAIAYEKKTVSLSGSSFTVNLLNVPRTEYRPVTAVAASQDCSHDCPVKSLADYANTAQAAAGINGSYFCPADYDSCSQGQNSFLWPVYDSASSWMANESNLKFHERALIAVDSQNRPSLYRNAKNEFGWSVTEFEQQTGRQLAAALGNYPTLVYGGLSVAHEEATLDSGMRTSKVRRGAWGWNQDSYLVAIAETATVVDMADIMLALGADFAMNLDGGGSAALWYGGQYLVGPGRQIPNALLFVPIDR